jgi:hypothetical protein
MHRNESPRSATDSLYLLRYLVNQPIEKLQTGNGDEFAWESGRAPSHRHREVLFQDQKRQ